MSIIYMHVWKACWEPLIFVPTILDNSRVCSFTWKKGMFRFNNFDTKGPVYPIDKINSPRQLLFQLCFYLCSCLNSQFQTGWARVCFSSCFDLQRWTSQQLRPGPNSGPYFSFLILVFSQTSFFLHSPFFPGEILLSHNPGFCIRRCKIGTNSELAKLKTQFCCFLWLEKWKQPLD